MPIQEEAHNLAADFPGPGSANPKDEFARWYAEVTAGQDFQQPPIQVGRDDENQGAPRLEL